MTTFYTTASFPLTESPPGFVPGDLVRGNAKRAVAVLDLSAVKKADGTTGLLLNGDTVNLFRIPVGAIFSSGTITSSVTLGSSTIAVGISGTTAKYKAAAVFTATDTPTGFGKASAVAEGGLTAPEDVLLTIAAADMPTSGILHITYSYSLLN